MLTMESLEKNLQPLDLLDVQYDNEIRHEIHFRRRRLPSGKRNLLSKVGMLKDGTLTGYIYVGHLREFDYHPDRTKMGYLPIKNLKEEQFKELLNKVTKHYR
ncbi:hypothetical protein HNQ94_000805 [Salirhabdus euzebyi]|uniref:Uncharacterized protein n=1 Tax=Salirhabdus euzebyi TaxID=394506 RepID=A0A841PU85_9BACI|nr:hypothetical protein [Salirhabdus euzebyi]MBB6452360.1 hypothetical protein [Salirhabdus euzebyi]